MPYPRYGRIVLAGMTALCLLASLSGCVTMQTVRVPVKVHPPAALLEPCPAPSPTATTNGELLAYLEDMASALRGCNQDKQALRDWAKE